MKMPESTTKNATWGKAIKYITETQQKNNLSKMKI